MTTRRPITGLAVDGLRWGGGVGALPTFRLFPVGLVVGGGVGFPIGLGAGLVPLTVDVVLRARGHFQRDR